MANLFNTIRSKLGSKAPLLAAGAPILGILAVKVLVPAGQPAGVQAAELSERSWALPSDKSFAALSPKQVELRDYVEQVARASVEGSPLLAARDRSVKPDPIQIKSTPKETVKRPGADAFAVSSILSGRRPLAVINGKACAVGADLEDGWRVVEIDGSAFKVVIEHAQHGRLDLVWRPDRR